VLLFLRPEQRTRCSEEGCVGPEIATADEEGYWLDSSKTFSTAQRRRDFKVMFRPELTHIGDVHFDKSEKLVDRPRDVHLLVSRQETLLLQRDNDEDISPLTGDRPAAVNWRLTEKLAEIVQEKVEALWRNQRSFDG